MIAAVHDDPLRLEASREPDVGREVFIGRIAHIRRDFRNVHGGQCMERERNPEFGTGLEYGRTAGVVEAFQRIGRDVRLHVDRPHCVARRPRDGILDRQFSSHVDANAIDKGHELSSRTTATGGRFAANVSRHYRAGHIFRPSSNSIYTRRGRERGN
jgi:hypothetical protein